METKLKKNREFTYDVMSGRFHVIIVVAEK